jgi:quinolinate synthase
MLDTARGLTAKTALVATEIGMLHQLRQVNKRTNFLPVNPKASCRFMKMITPELLVRCLREGRDEIQLPPEVVERARRSVERMVAIGKPAGAR